MKKGILSLLLALGIISCTLMEPKRNPAAVQNVVSSNHIADINIPFSDLKLAFSEATKTSPILESINHFYMDPVTRIFNINLTVNYPLDKLLDFTQIPEDRRPTDRHEVEIGFKFSKSKNLYRSRYVGIQITKFNLDDDSYLNQFDLILGVIQTVLANSQLTDYLLVENRDKLPNDDTVALVSEIFEKNVIRVFPTTRKINLKLDLSMVSELSPFLAKNQDLNLWRLSPSVLQVQEGNKLNPKKIHDEDVAFSITVGKGKPSDDYSERAQAFHQEDNRNLQEVREEHYQALQNLDNIKANAELVYSQLEKGEETPLKRLMRNKIQIKNDSGSKIINNLKGKYQRKIEEITKTVLNRAEDVLSMDNEHFVAAPEYEYGEFLSQMKSYIRHNYSELERKFDYDYQKLQSGKKYGDDKPILVKRISQNLINHGLNATADVVIDGHTPVDELSVWLQPSDNKLFVKGVANIPLNFILKYINKGLGLEKEAYKTHLMETKSGLPFEAGLAIKMNDKGVLSLEFDYVKFEANGTEQRFSRNSKNQAFIFDFAKIMLAKNLAALKVDLSETTDPDEAKRIEMDQILNYLKELSGAYGKTNELEQILASDVNINPFNLSGLEHLQKKKEILIGDLIEFNQQNQSFDIRIDPRIVIDKIQNVSHNLQVWDITPIMSSELNNTFLEVSVGYGQPSNDYIHEQYRRSGVAENAEHSAIYYDLGKERASVDSIISINNEYLSKYINNFLNEVAKANGTDLVAEAKKDQGNPKFQIKNLNLSITPKKELKLAVDVEMARFGRGWSNWFSPKLTQDTHTFHANLKLESLKYNKPSTNLKDLTFYPSAIKVMPTNVKIAPGSNSGFVTKALTKILNSTVKLALSNGTAKKLLLKMLGKMMGKMYTEKKGVLMGHEIEKFVRIQTTQSDILLFLNPKLLGPAFNFHLAGEENPVNQAIKLSVEDKSMHFAFTAGAAMARTHKLELLKIYKEMEDFLKPFEKAKTKDELKSLLKGQGFAQSLVKNTDKSKRSFYNRMIAVLTRYDQVFHVTRIGNKVNFAKQVRLENKDQDISSSSERTRISASGAELIYFAALGKFMQQKLKEVKVKLIKHNLSSNNYGFSYIKDAEEILAQNIVSPLLKEYKKTHHAKNKIIISSEPSYWTYQVLPNAYFAEKAYQIIK